MVSPSVLTDARRSVGGGVGSCAPRQVSFFMSDRVVLPSRCHIPPVISEKIKLRR